MSSIIDGKKGKLKMDLIDEILDRMLEENLGNDKTQNHECVDIIASGYEWTCPKCNTLNRIGWWTEIVICSNRGCWAQFKANPPEHACD
jgi:hypothetical protein